MKKFIGFTLIFLLSISFMGCLSSNRIDLSNELNLLDLDNTILYIDGNHFHDIYDDIDTKDLVSYTQYLAVFQQNENLYDLVIKNAYDWDLMVDQSELLRNIEETNDYEVTSTIKLIFKSGVRKISEDLHVVWYNLNEKYDNESQSLNRYYNIEVDSYGYYSWQFTSNEIYYSLYYNIEDISEFMVLDEKVTVQEHYLGYDFTFEENESIIDRIHIPSFDKLYPGANDKKLQIYKGEDILSTYDMLKDIGISVVITTFDNPLFTIIIKDEFNEKTIFSDILYMHDLNTFQINSETNITYELVKENVVAYTISTDTSHISRRIITT